MKDPAVNPAQGRAALTAAVKAAPSLLGLPGQVCTAHFRGERVTVVADRPPVTDVLALELAPGNGEAASVCRRRTRRGSRSFPPPA